LLSLSLSFKILTSCLNALHQQYYANQARSAERRGQQEDAERLWDLVDDDLCFSDALFDGLEWQDPPSKSTEEDRDCEDTENEETISVVGAKKRKFSDRSTEDIEELDEFRFSLFDEPLEQEELRAPLASFDNFL